MKVLKTKVHTYTDDGYKDSIRKRNIDSEEILKWMRELAKIEAFGLKELPLWKGYSIGRFIATDSLQEGDTIIHYMISPKHGLIRQFIPINSKRFTNNAHATQLSCMSKEKLMMSLLKHKDGKRVHEDGLKAIKEWEERWLAYREQGGYKYDPIRVVVNANADDVDVELKDNYNLEDLKKVCQYIVEYSGNFDKEDLYPLEERHGYYDNMPSINFKTY